jgi:putative tricarboxylic transport membrane protein
VSASADEQGLPAAPDADEAGPRARTQALIGAGLLLLALALWLDAARLPPHLTAGVGPAAAPRLVGALLALLGVAHLVLAWRRRHAAIGAPPHGNLAALAWVMAALAGLMAAIGFEAGFIVGSTWLFAATARGFGERLSVKSVGIGLALSVLVYLFFTRVLSLALPSGPLERLIPGA